MTGSVVCAPVGDIRGGDILGVSVIYSKVLQDERKKPRRTFADARISILLIFKDETLSPPYCQQSLKKPFMVIVCHRLALLSDLSLSN